MFAVSILFEPLFFIIVIVENGLMGWRTKEERTRTETNSLFHVVQKPISIPSFSGCKTITVIGEKKPIDNVTHWSVAKCTFYDRRRIPTLSFHILFFYSTRVLPVTVALFSLNQKKNCILIDIVRSLFSPVLINFLNVFNVPKMKWNAVTTLFCSFFLSLSLFNFLFVLSVVML